MEKSRGRPPPVAAKPLHTRSKSMPERANLERQNSVEDDDSQSYRSGSSGDPMSPTTYDEFVKSKGMMQDDQEVWMSMADAATAVTSVQKSLDSWKSRRRRATHSVLERKASRDEVEQTEHERQRRRSKTYSEMMEEKEKREKILMTMATKNKSLDPEDIVHILTKPALYEDEIKDLPERDDVQVVYRNGSSMLRNSYSSEVYAVAPPSNVETLTFKEKLLRDREREIGMTAEQRNSKSSARLPQKKRLSMGILGRVAAFNKGESAFEHETKPKTPAPKEEIRVPEHSELTIQMEQKPRNENGFGFTIIGGSDTQRPIVVTSVTKGSSADSCDLKVGDEIVAINGEKTKTFDNDHAMYCFSSSILTGELTLKIHRYKEPGMRKHDSSSRQTTESTRSTTNQPEVTKRRAVSQPADPRALTQAARAKKILQQMRDEEEKIEDMRREREEERRKPAVNGNSIWNHRAETQDPVRSHYDDPEGYGAILSDGEMFSSEEDERPETDMNRMQRAEEEAAPRHRHNEEDPKTKDSMEEDLITPQSKLTEEAPISFKRFSQEESAPPQSQGPRPFQHHTSVDSSKPPTFHPIKFSAPKPFSNRLGPEPFRPASFKPVAMREKGVKQDMMQRRSDFFNDEKDQNDRSGQSSPITALSASSEETVPPPINQEAEESTEIPRQEAKQPASLSSRKAFNVEEEKKRLERWHAEQDRIRQEQYEQEQRRLKEQQEKDLERAEAEERKKKMEEHQHLLEKQRLLQEQAAEERQRLEEERKERTKKEQEFLERARLEREEAERERLDDEEEQRKMAAERMKREEERRMKEQEDKRRLEEEKRAEEEEQRRLEKEEWQQREIERQDQEAEARRLEINRLQEKEKAERLRRKQEEEARMAREHEQKETERFARLRDEEIERIRKEEREKLRQEWEELQREKAKQDERERLELERLDQLRAEQERLRQERILMEEQQERERRQLQKEKERLMTQSAAFKQPKESTKPMSEEIPYNKPEMESEVLEKENKLQDYDNSVVEKEIIVSQENKDVFSAPPPKNAPAENFQVPGQAYLSQYKDGKMGSQHWLVEEAERRRLAEKNGTMRLQEPVESHTGPIQRKDLDLEPVLEKKSHAPDHVAPVRRSDKPAMIQEPAIPPSRQQPKPQPRKETTNQGFREVAVDVPPNFQGVQRRLRAPEVEAERKKKTQNRRSMPDMGNRVPDVVRSESHTPPPVPSDRNSDRMPDNFLQQPQLGPPGRSSAFQQPSKKPAPGRSVSGKVTCSNCAKTLGRGAAMIIESLGLHYHIECFRCCVCNIRLGNGSQGTDVRIRASKLHCQNCYSNDAGFEFTEV